MVEVQIDASDQILGRLASEVAQLLMGKNSAAFEYRKSGDVRVVVKNTDKIHVTGKKPDQKLYRHHSGFHGGLKETRYTDLFAKDSRKVLENAVMGMLPKNKLRIRRMKQLIMFKSDSK